LSEDAEENQKDKKITQEAEMHVCVFKATE
jgi:hypothetical protein